MLDSETKRRIDTARDILVGKVPDPKSQVEQITIALIYKFMDDIDAESEEFGGKRKYFAGDFERFGWAKLMQPGLGGHETLGLYAEAIERMDENAGIPQLFRDIFRNAFLPYRDPETLRAFLKVIDVFTYDHSERLGDAFEYLLSVMDSQGDAGQFRTPRHIIDFIVSIVDPKKEDVILDPACGTGGFLISSYKHILAANTDADGNSTLTPDERERLARNLMGYDISPDMVRLSLVNMYLHGLVEPNIYEYDTLTSEERWNEFADVILANPPFMSPKGGIRPHNRFSVKARRSEVLFVDYIAEHLNAGGRAGIIVPEGVIFQSQNAHRKLRKKLVEESLVAVVSLPAGVFNPYSGVKTSILLLDKALARKTDKIAFFVAENDGFDLGAQRLPIDGNDLPNVQAETVEYLNAMRSNRTQNDVSFRNGIVIEKRQIVADEDYNLIGRRYLQGETRLTEKEWPLIKLGEICDIANGSTPSRKVAEYWENGNVPWFTIEDIRKNGPIVRETIQFTTAKALNETSLKLLPRNSVLLCCTASVGACAFTEIELTTNQQFNGLIVRDEYSGRLLPKFLFYIATRLTNELLRLSGKTSFSFVSGKSLKAVEIPLPPMEVQKELVAEIDGYQKVIDGARAVVENYRPHIHVDPEWPMVELGDCCTVKGGKRLPRGVQYEVTPTDYPYIRVADFRDGSVDVNGLKYISGSVQERISRYTISSSDVYISIAGTIGLMGTVPEELDGANLTENAAKLMFDQNRIDKRFLTFVGNGEAVQTQIRNFTHAVGVPKLALRRIEMISIPLPPIEVQREHSAEVEMEQALVNANRELIGRFKRKIKKKIAGVWNE